MDYDLAEIAVLSSAMRDATGRSSATALEHLTEEDFATTERQRIFSVLSKLAPACNDVDVMMELPELSDTAADVSEIDHFVWARLAGKGLTAAAEADRVALIRRVTLDLNGLPPTIAEVSSFVADSLRDRRSASAQFASLWGTHGAVLAGCRSMWRHTRPASG